MSLSTLRPLPSDVDAAEATVVGMGAKVVRKVAGTMLIEATPTVVAKLVRALPRWRVHPEGGSYRVPERRPLERAKLAANAK